MAGFCDDLESSCTTLLDEFPAPVAARTVCPNDDDDPSDPDRCLNWASPEHCIGDTGGVLCDNHFDTIQDAIDSSLVGAGDTILVWGPNFSCVPCQPSVPVYSESLTVDKRVCLKARAPGFWDLAPAGTDYRYPAIIRSSTSSSFVIDVTPDGSGSCIQGFHIDHRGDAGTAVRIGTTAICTTCTGTPTAEAALANNVTLVGNRIDVGAAVSTAEPNGVMIAGKGNRIHGNVIRGGQRDGSRGVSLGPWSCCDDSDCADWDRNDINGNQIAGFEDGVRVEMSGPVACGTYWEDNRIDRNEISDCNAGIRTGAGGDAVPMRLAIMENHVRDGRLYSSTTHDCDPDDSAKGIWVGDLGQSDVVGNHISGVQVGIHVAYDTCWTRVKRNQIAAVENPVGQRYSSGISMCPSHCNWLVENLLSGDDTDEVYGINFENRDQRRTTPCFSTPKEHGRHILDGGLIQNVQAITREREAATIQLMSLPGRADFEAVNVE